MKCLVTFNFVCEGKKEDVRNFLKNYVKPIQQNKFFFIKTYEVMRIKNEK